MAPSIAWVTTRPFTSAEVKLDGDPVKTEVTLVADRPHVMWERVNAVAERALAPEPGRFDEIEAYVESTEEGPMIDRSPLGEGYAWGSHTSSDDREAISLPAFFARFLHELVFELKAERCLECGTAHGVSGLYQASALERLGAGHLVTVEADPVRRQLAVAAFERLLPGRVTSVEGLFADALPGVLAGLDGRLDFVYEDGPHFPETTLEVFGLVWPHLRPLGVMAIDDIHFPTGNTRAWNEIRNHPEVGAAVEVNGRVGVIVKKRRAA